MPLFRRRVPEAVARLPVPPGDRRLAWALTASGEPVVAAGAGLLLPGRELLAWRQVEHAQWQRPVLRVREVADVEGSGRQHELELADEGDLPDVVRDRVTTSVAWTRHTRLAPDGGVRVVGRRVPEVDQLEWQLVFDRGTDPTDPLVRAQAEQVLEAARRMIG